MYKSITTDSTIKPSHIYTTFLIQATQKIFGMTLSILSYIYWFIPFIFNFSFSFF